MVWEFGGQMFESGTVEHIFDRRGKERSEVLRGFGGKAPRKFSCNHALYFGYKRDLSPFS